MGMAHRGRRTGVGANYLVGQSGASKGAASSVGVEGAESGLEWRPAGAYELEGFALSATGGRWLAGEVGDEGAGCHAHSPVRHWCRCFEGGDSCGRHAQPACPNVHNKLHSEQGCSGCIGCTIVVLSSHFLHGHVHVHCARKRPVCCERKCFYRAGKKMICVLRLSG
jgi:hypothetical protein